MRVNSFVIFAVAGLLASACASPNRVPTWAIHLERPTVEVRPDLAAYRGRLLSELGQPALGPGHLSGDQVAALALSDLAAGRTADAALLLSLASYRYHQQAIRVLELGPGSDAELARLRQQGLRIDRQAYYRHIRNEVEAAASLNFDGLLGSYETWSDAGRLQRYLTERTVAQLDPSKRAEGMSSLSRLAGQLERLSAAPEPQLRATRIAEAYRVRLQADTASEVHARSATRHLALTPLAAYREAALDEAVHYFVGPTIRAFATRPEDITASLEARLASSRPQTRSLAALILGQRAAADLADRAPVEGRAAALEAALASETDALVQLSLLQSLVLSGEVSRLAELEERIRAACPGATTCLHALLQVEWMPDDLVVALDEAGLAALLSDSKQDGEVRFFAARALGRLGRTGAISDASLQALLLLSDNREDDELAAVARFEVSRLPALDARKTAQLLGHSHTGRAALLSRLAEVGTAEQLPALVQYQDRLWHLSPAERSAFIAVLARIPGSLSDSLLTAAYHQLDDEARRLQIAVVLTGEGNRAPALRQQILAGPLCAASLLLKVDAGSPDATTALVEQLRSGSPFQRVIACQLAGGSDAATFAPLLWSLASYRSDTEYPADMYVRQAALEALFTLELRASIQRFVLDKRRQDAFAPATRTGL